MQLDSSFEVFSFAFPQQEGKSENTREKLIYETGEAHDTSVASVIHILYKFCIHIATHTHAHTLSCVLQTLTNVPRSGPSVLD